VTGQPVILEILMDGDIRDALAHRTLYMGTNGYVYFSTNRTGPITLHAFVMGGTLAGLHIDHVNGDRLDNRRENLRFVTPSGNQVNRKRLSSANTSGIRGVRRRSGLSLKKPWLAQIMVDGKGRYLGVFETMEEAAAARRAAEVEFWGETCP
jgi:hypothetical protein